MTGFLSAWITVGVVLQCYDVRTLLDPKPERLVTVQRDAMRAATFAFILGFLGSSVLVTVNGL